MLAATAFAPDRLIPAITGRITDEQWRASIESAAGSDRLYFRLMTIDKADSNDARAPRGGPGRHVRRLASLVRRRAA
jgi:hypothetical protein